jgi:hypothetical protein
MRTIKFDFRRCLQRLILAVGFSLACLPSAVLAHSNEYLEAITGAHGGKLRMAEQYHFEMLLTNGELRVWVSDHGDNPQATAGATGSVKLVAEAGIVTVNLIPSGANLLVGKDPKIRANAPVKAIATVTMKGQKPLQTRFAFEAATKK